MAVPSLVMGICSIGVPLVLCFLLGIQNIFGVVLGVLAIVFAVPAMKKQPEKKNVAIAGLVTGIVGTVFSFFGLISWILLWGTVGMGVNAFGEALKHVDSKALEQSLNSPETQKGLNDLKDALKGLETLKP